MRGVSTGDFREALAALLGKEAPNLSPAVVARLKGEWEADYVHWQRRDLLARRYVCIWTDGVYPHAMALVRSHRGLRMLVMLKAARGASRFVSQYEGAGEGTYNDHLPASPTPHVKVAPPRHARGRMKARFPAIGL